MQLINLPEAALAQLGPIRTMRCIQSGLPFMLSSFPTVADGVLALTIVALSGEPAITVEDVVAVASGDVVAVAPS